MFIVRADTFVREATGCQTEARLYDRTLSLSLLPIIYSSLSLWSMGIKWLSLSPRQEMVKMMNGLVGKDKWKLRKKRWTVRINENRSVKRHNAGRFSSLLLHEKVISCTQKIRNGNILHGKVLLWLWISTLLSRFTSLCHKVYLKQHLTMR